MKVGHKAGTPGQSGMCVGNIGEMGGNGGVSRNWEEYGGMRLQKLNFFAGGYFNCAEI